MSIENALYKRLVAVSGVTALVSTRVYINKAPQKPTLPYVVLEADDDNAPAHAMGADIGIKRADVRLYCYAGTPQAAKEISLAVTAALRRYSGTHDAIEILDGYLRGDRPSTDDSVKSDVQLVEFEIVYQ